MRMLAIEQSAENPLQLTVADSKTTRLLDDAALEELTQISAAYRRVSAAHVDRKLDEKLRPLGNRLRVWLGGWAKRIPVNGGLEWRLPVTRDERTNRVAAVIADAPWEILADDNGCLAKQPGSHYLVIHRLLVEAQLPPPTDYKLSLLFMASSPHGQPELDYRDEEVAIEKAAGERGLDLTVEESGELKELGRTLAQTKDRPGSVEVLHLSCHGLSDLEPRLAMETETGEDDLVPAYRLWEHVGDKGLDLGFISACHTGHANQQSAASYAAQLVLNGLPAALAWAGAVKDNWATVFAATFYEYLSQGLAIDAAYLRARNGLANIPDCSDWHLARLMLAENAGGALCTGGERSRRDIGIAASGEASFLGGNRLVPVARFEEFVGRRRELQRAIRALRKQKSVLLHGPGNLGKSSLAGRLARRFPDHHHAVIHSSEFSTEKVLQTIERCCQCEPVTAAVNNTHAGNLRDGLRNVLRLVEQHGKPVLLFLDDFERQLKKPETDDGLHRLQDRYQHTVGQILAVFGNYGGTSRLVITGRHNFELVDNGRDATAFIERIQLEPFGHEDHERQVARLRQTGPEQRDLSPLERHLQAVHTNRAIALAGGNPGLLRKLWDYINTHPDGAAELLKEVEVYLAGGRKPTDSDVGDYLERLTIGAMLDALTEVETHLLSVSRGLDLPVPVAAMEKLAEQSLGASQEQARHNCRRLMSFGLWDYHPDPADASKPACAINGLLARRIDEPEPTAMSKYAQWLLPLLDTAWPAKICPSVCDAQLLGLAVQIDHRETLRQRSETGLQYLLGNHLYGKGYPLAHAAIECDEHPPYELLRIGGELAIGAGENEIGRTWLKKARTLAPEPETAEAAYSYGAVLRALGRSERAIGNLENAESLLKEVQVTFKKFGFERERVVLSGDIADILQARGELDEALRIRREDQLPVYERLGDVRARAVTMGKIADILQARGELDEALRIRREDELPVFERLGAVREIAVTHQKLFGLYLQKKENQRAIDSITKAFQITQQLQIPDGISITGFQLGQVLLAMGQKDEARKVLEQSKAAFEKLGDLKMAAAVEELLQQSR